MVKVLGRLVRDVVLSEVDVGGVDKLVLNNALAMRNSNSKNESSFIDITAWDGRAELIAKFFGKGDEILITGELRNRKVDTDGDLRTVVYLLVEKIEFVNGKKRNLEG